MKLVAIVPLALSGLVIAVVGLRLFAQGLRTRRLPELALGGGIVCASFVGEPLCAIARVPALIGTPLGDALFVAGVAISHAGLALLWVFTWSVFRRRSRAALALTCAASAALAVAAGGLISIGVGSRDMQTIFAHTRPFALTTIAVVALFFLWNALESVRCARMQTRRLALGLGDPVVRDRFRLWASVGASSAILCAALGASMAAGRAPLTDPFAVATTALMATLSAVAWYLSFLPPERYVAWVRERAKAARGGAACA